MIIHATICGYHDWEPAPPGTKITQADIDALRVKQMADGKWHMRVVKIPLEGNDHTGVMIPESAICDRMASLEKFGRSQSRAATVVELLQNALKHHIDARKHLVGFDVLDSAPNADMYADDLARLGISDEQAAASMSSYMEEVDMPSYLNSVFQAKPSRALYKKESI